MSFKTTQQTLFLPFLLVAISCIFSPNDAHGHDNAHTHLTTASLQATFITHNTPTHTKQIPQCSYNVGKIRVDVPRITLQATSRGLIVENVSFAFFDKTHAEVGGWITNTSNSDLCLVEVETATCTTDKGVHIEDCARSFVLGDVSANKRGDTTSSCLKPGQRAPFLDVFELPKHAVGQSIQHIQISLAGQPFAIQKPASAVVLQEKLSISESHYLGQTYFRADGTITNTGSRVARIQPQSARVLVIDKHDHIIASAPIAIKHTKDSKYMQPNTVSSWKTYTSIPLRADDFAEIRVHFNWKDGLSD